MIPIVPIESWFLQLPYPLVPPKILKPIRRELRIHGCVLYVAVPHVELDRPRVLAVVRQRVSAGVAKHVRMDDERKPRPFSYPADHLSKPGSRRWRTTL